jgi:hypothetical protein
MTPENHALLSSTLAGKILLPVAVGQVLGGLESLCSAQEHEPSGYLRGHSRLQPGPSALPQRFRRFLDSATEAKVLNCATIAGGLLILGRRHDRAAQVAGAALMVASNKLSEIRTPYGRDGADQMAAVILSYRLATALIPDRDVADDVFLRAVNLQTCVSYLASGAAKAISSTWLSGEALGMVLQTNSYGQSFAARQLLKQPRLMRLLTWATIGWESAFPVVYALTPRRADQALVLVKLFHLGVALTMGLPRFFWGFSASHHSVVYVIQKRCLSRGN